MSHYKPYSAYKDSGVEWLGKVPEHWSIGQMKSGIKSLQNGIWGEEPNGGVDDVPCARVADFDRVRLVVQEPLPTIRSIPLAQRIYKRVNTGDLLLEKSGGGEKTTVGAMAQYFGELDVVCSNFVAVVKCKLDISARWLCYANNHLYALGVNTRSIKQTTGIQNLDSNQYSSELIAFPAFAEQQAIAAHLDRETARIDALISKKTRFIELLREKRQALITHAVTKGLDPNVKMKDSGVEWLGEVPEHWVILNFQRCVYIAEGQVNPEVHPYSEMMLIAPNHIESGTGRLLYTETAAEQNAESGKYLCREGDVVYSKIRPALRKVCIAPSDSLCSADMYPLRGDDTILNQYLLWFLLSEPFSAFAVLEADRVAMPKINRESLNALKLAVPPIEEQENILSHLTKMTARIDSVIDKTERSIELLKERRSALITAAVTGQIDLRETA